MSSSLPTLRDRLLAAREALGFTAAQLAKELRITPEWVSKIMRGHVVGSDDIHLRLDVLLRSKGIEPSSISAPSTSTPLGAAINPLAGGGHAADVLRGEIRKEIEVTISAAGSDVSRLGWLLEELRSLRPSHWESAGETEGELSSDHERAIRSLALEKRRRNRAS